ncbi:MAG TPA: M48 family metallopeptidase [Steroidobacteraceae bacterium]|jgi:STE24 endopeptidase|nr:M48 family metallopeptidase [Steroidobacteraceae bacterium]
MHALTIVFILAVAVETATRLWLASRQINAVRAHRNEVPEMFRGEISLADQQKAADYTVARVALGRVSTVFDGIFRLLLTVGGGVAAVDALWRHSGLGEPWRGALTVGSIFLALRLAGLPFALRRTFKVEARFGFNRMTLPLFAVDLVKHLLLAVILGGPLLLAVITLMDHGGTWWWLWAWGLWLLWTLSLTWAAPRFIAPLFNKFSPLADEVLKKRVEVLLERCGFSARGGVYVMDGSLRSAHGNAYFTGIGRSKRIVFFDTLLTRIDAAGIEAVLAHELGHFRLHHIGQRLAATVLAGLAVLAILAWSARLPEFYPAFGVRVPSSETALLLFMLMLPVFVFFTTPIVSRWSRRQETAADEFAAAHADPGNLVTALVALFRDNASTLTPDGIHSSFFDSHPPAIERIARLNALAAVRPLIPLPSPGSARPTGGGTLR